MTPPKALRTTYGIALVLLLVGALCYAAAPLQSPDTPLRMVFKSAAGKVWFDHQTHTAATASGYGLACNDCHHHPADDDQHRACGDCHRTPETAEAAKPVCLECHDEDEIDMEAVPTRTNAFHDQCIKCHKDASAGPAVCAACHVL